MARPIIPARVRRLHFGGHLELMSRGGVWIPYNLVAHAVSERAIKMACERGYLMPNSQWPSSPFDYDLTVQSEQNTDTPAPQVDDDNDSFGPKDSESDAEQVESSSSSSSESDSDSDTETQSESESEQQNKENAEMSMEDIVRRIAGELDGTQQEGIDAALADVLANVDKRLEDFQPKSDTTNTLVPIITRVEISLPETTITTDGVFHMAMPDLLFNIQLGTHTYLPGSPGTGKSHAAGQAAEALGWKFGSISFGPTTPESRLVGGMTADGSFFEPMLLKLVRFAMENPDSGAVMCLDEMDNGHAGVQATLNSLLANGWMTAPNGDHLTIGNNLVFIACANTYGTGPTAEFSGRNKLDAATLDRFAYLPWEIDLGLEEVLVRRFFSDDQQYLASHWLDVWRSARQNVATRGLKLFVTPRGAQAGARMVAAGRTVEKSLAQVLGNKVPADQWSKINPL